MKPGDSNNSTLLVAVILPSPFTDPGGSILRNFHLPSSGRAPFLFALAAVIAACACPVHAQLPPGLSKGHRVLIEQGLQIQGMVNIGDPFHLATYQGLNYTGVNWIWARA